MILLKWDELPDFMRCDEVRSYYNILDGKRVQLLIKRICDFLLALLLLVILLIPMIIIAVIIKIDSSGPIMFRQERVTRYGKPFRIHKFRTMVNNAEKIGTGVTVSGDARITKVGRALRKLRIDEIPQLIDVLAGNMSFVGTRPEVPKYVKCYTNEMYGTLLLPAGITSETSIRYKDEEKLLDAANDVDKVYVEQVLPEKMVLNLKSVKQFSLIGEFLTLFRTIAAIMGKEYRS